MPGPDGLEQRTAYYAEAFALDEEFDELMADEADTYNDTAWCEEHS